MSRFFAPGRGINEDPVTGSAHCNSYPFLGGPLGKEQTLRPAGIEARGELFCELVGDRVKISGRAVVYAEGAIYI